MKKKFLPIAIIIEYILAFLVITRVSSNRDQIIIDQGIHFYQNASIASKVFLGIVVIASIVELLVYLRSRKKEQELLERRIEAEMEEKRAMHRKEAMLSVKEKLDRDVLHDLLQEASLGDWKALSVGIRECDKDLLEIEEMQKKLQRLLKHNDAAALDQSGEVLEQVEQYICKAIRKALNYMEISDANNEKDVRVVKTKLTECHIDCKQQLGRTQDFLYAMTDFLNKQGEKAGDMDMIDIYKKAIMESLEERV